MSNLNLQKLRKWV